MKFYFIFIYLFSLFITRKEQTRGMNLNFYRKEETECIRLLVSDDQEVALSFNKEKQHPKIHKLKNCSIFFPLDEISETEIDEVIR